MFSCSDKKSEPSFRTGMVQAGSMSIYYEIHGKGDPVLLLHAGLQTHSMWDEQVKALSADHEVITIDLPRHGRSVGSDTTTLVQEMILTVLDSLKVEKAAVASLSLGASVAQDFVIAYPNRVLKLILMSSGVNGIENIYKVDSISSAWYPAFAVASDSNRLEEAALIFAKAWGDGLDAQDSLVKPSSKFVYATTLDNLKKHNKEFWPKFRETPPAVESIKTIRVPVLIIHGDRDLPFINQTSKFLEKSIPGAQRVMLPGLAHMINLEQPKEINKLMEEFLKKKD